MRDDRQSTRRKVIKGMSAGSLALMGTGVASASNEESEAEITSGESDKPVLEQIVEGHGKHTEVTLVTCKVDKNGDVSKVSESTINLENIDSAREARNDSSVMEKIPDHLRSDSGEAEESHGKETEDINLLGQTQNDKSVDIRGLGNSDNNQYTQEENEISLLRHGGHNTNYYIERDPEWKLTLYSTYNWDADADVLARPYEYTYSYSTSDSWEWDGVQDSEITGLGTAEGHHRIEGKFSALLDNDTPFLEIGFKVTAISGGQVDYKISGTW